MKGIILGLLFILGVTTSRAQETEYDADGCRIFYMQTSNGARVMKEYQMVIYLKGDDRDQDSVTAAEIQQAHMAFINRMAEEGKLSIAGPFGDDGLMRGILIFNVPDEKAAALLMEQDKAIQSGRLRYEIHPWWSEKGAVLK